MDIAKTCFSWDSQDCEIRISLENGGLATAIFGRRHISMAKRLFPLCGDKAMKVLAESKV